MLNGLCPDGKLVAETTAEMVEEDRTIHAEHKVVDWQSDLCPADYEGYFIPTCPGKDKCRVYALLASRQVATAVLA